VISLGFARRFNECGAVWARRNACGTIARRRGRVIPCGGPSIGHVSRYRGPARNLLDSRVGPSLVSSRLVSGGPRDPVRARRSARHVARGRKNSPRYSLSPGVRSPARLYFSRETTKKRGIRREAFRPRNSHV